MKKLILAFVLMIVIVSCGAPTENSVVTSDSTEVAKTDSNIVISVSTDSTKSDTATIGR